MTSFRTYSLIALLASLPVGTALPSYAAENPPASAAPEAALEVREHFARDFAQKVLAILQDQKKSFDDRKGVLRQAFSNSVDIDWIARFVLGRAWLQATPEQQQRYTELYRKYLTESYVTNFGEDKDKRIRDIKIYGVNNNQGDEFTVRTEMMLANFESLNVSYRVSDNSGKYRIRDITIENVSLIATHRAEFSQLVSTHGVSGVIAKLEEVTRSGKPPIAFSMAKPEKASNPL